MVKQQAQQRCAREDARALDRVEEDAVQAELSGAAGAVGGVRTAVRNDVDVDLRHIGKQLLGERRLA